MNRKNDSWRQNILGVTGGEAPVAAGQGAGDSHATGGEPSGVTVRRRRRFKPRRLYRIGDVVRYSGVSRQTIHNYTTMGLLCEADFTPGGHRLYDESVFDRLAEILDLKDLNLSLRQIRKHFANRDQDEMTPPEAGDGD